MSGGGAVPAVPDHLRDYRYKPRHVGPLDPRPVGRWIVKATAITVRGTAAHFPDVIEGAWAEAERRLAEVADGGRDAGVGHLMIHLGLGGVWLLLDWWAEGEILMHRQFRASLDDPTRFIDLAPRHYGSCVWELAVQAHERDAWLRHVLANPAGPDLAAYLADGLSGTI